MCNHREAIPGDECLLSIVGKLFPPFRLSFLSPFWLSGDKNKHRYVIATQSHPLRVKLRAIPGTPIVHINRSVMILEPPSDATLKVKEMVCFFPLLRVVFSTPQQNEHQKLHATAVDLLLVDPPSSKDLKKRKGPKGPNPLSMKKKKINDASLHTDSGKIANHKGDAQVSTGLKRKANFSEENEDDDVIQQTSSSNPKSRRRKRRKKHHTIEETSHLNH